MFKISSILIIYILLKYLIIVIPGFVKVLAKNILERQSPFDASLSPTASKECKLQMKKYLDSLQTLEFWALKSKFFF